MYVESSYISLEGHALANQRLFKNVLGELTNVKCCVYFF